MSATTTKRKSQKERVLTWLQDGNAITSFQAYVDFGITQLGTVIFYLKREGYKIQTRWIDRNGSRFKEYFL